MLYMWMNASFISFWGGVGLKYLFSELLMEKVTGTKVLRYWLKCHEISFKFMYWQNLSSICQLAEILCPAFQNFENGVATHATTPRNVWCSFTQYCLLYMHWGISIILWRYSYVSIQRKLVWISPYLFRCALKFSTLFTLFG